MPSAGYQREAAVLEALVPNLEAQGYEVFIHPDQTILPTFMGNYRPDLVALRPDKKKLAVEIIARPVAPESRPQRIDDIFSGHPDWELRIIYAPPNADMDAIANQWPEAITRLVAQLPKLLDDGGAVPALLTIWAVFEAAARLAAPDQLRRPQPPARLVEVMASDGHITPDEADVIRRVAKLRNRAAHGELDITFPKTDLEQTLNIIQMLLKNASGEPQAPQA